MKTLNFYINRITNRLNLVAKILITQKLIQLTKRKLRMKPTVRLNRLAKNPNYAKLIYLLKRMINYV